MTLSVDTVLEPAYALLEDVRVVFPELHAQLVYDMDELKSRATSRGLGVLLLDMPELGKLYDKGLSSGYLDTSRWPNSLRRRGAKPHLFEGLVRRSFHGCGTLESIEPEPEIVFFTRCLFYIYKKLDCPPRAGSKLESVFEYIEVDNSLRPPSLDWLDPSSSYGVKDLSFTDLPLDQGAPASLRKMLLALDRVCAILRFPECDPYKILPKHGPGAVADLESGRDKYSPLIWPLKLEDHFPIDFFLSVRGDLDLLSRKSSMPHSVTDTVRLGVQGLYGVAKLHDVPKTYKGPRLITVEPTAQQFIQGGLLKWIRANMHFHYRASISFHDQEPSRELALKASTDGRLATVDLSSASDRLSCWVVERFVGHVNLRSLLMASRTPYVSLSKYGIRDLLKLKKFAGMGSAVTFPIQSLFYFAAAVSAVATWNGLNPAKIRSKDIGRIGKSIRVFGDDIILPSSAVPYLDLLFSSLDLKLNASKTHVQGQFRESCGMDAYQGYEVTPLYLTSVSLGKSSRALTSWVDIRNEAYSKGLWSLARWFESKVPQGFARWIPKSNQNLGALKYHTFLSGTYATRWRWNNSYHAYECKALALRSRQERVVRGTMLDLLQYFLESPGPDSFWEPGYPTVTRDRLGPVWVIASNSCMQVR